MHYTNMCNNFHRSSSLRKSFSMALTCIYDYNFGEVLKTVQNGLSPILLCMNIEARRNPSEIHVESLRNPSEILLKSL